MENAHNTYQLLQKIKSDYQRGLPASIKNQLATITKDLEDYIGITTAKTVAQATKSKEMATDRPFFKLGFVV